MVVMVVMVVVGSCGGSVAHATWHHSSWHSQERQQLLAVVRAVF